MLERAGRKAGIAGFVFDGEVVVIKDWDSRRQRKRLT
jgi:hypothetical protein